MSANGISHLPTRQQRQEAKLALAATNRAARSGHRDTAHTADDRYVLDITELPTKFSGNSIVNNPNSGGLVQGRPWK